MAPINIGIKHHQPNQGNANVQQTSAVPKKYHLTTFLCLFVNDLADNSDDEILTCSKGLANL